MRRKAQRRRPLDVDVSSTAAPSASGASVNGSNGNGAVLHNGAAATTRELEVPIAALVATEAERRVGDRRQIRRRRDDNNPFQRASEEAGWAG